MSNQPTIFVKEGITFFLYTESFKVRHNGTDANDRPVPAGIDGALHPFLSIEVPQLKAPLRCGRSPKKHDSFFYVECDDPDVDPDITNNAFTDVLTLERAILQVYGNR